MFGKVLSIILYSQPGLLWACLLYTSTVIATGFDQKGSKGPDIKIDVEPFNADELYIPPFLRKK